MTSTGLSLGSKDLQMKRYLTLLLEAVIQSKVDHLDRAVMRIGTVDRTGRKPTDLCAAVHCTGDTQNKIFGLHAPMRIDPVFQAAAASPTGHRFAGGGIDGRR